MEKMSVQKSSETQGYNSTSELQSNIRCNLHKHGKQRNENHIELTDEKVYDHWENNYDCYDNHDG